MADNDDADDGPYAFSDYVPPRLFPSDGRPPPPEDAGQPHIEVNPLVVSTMGLEALHGRIHRRALDAASCGHSGRTPLDPAAHEARLAAAWCGGPGGRLRLGGGSGGSEDLAALPLLARRYCALRLLGEGTFAQILECEDTLAPTRQRPGSYTANSYSPGAIDHGVGGRGSSSRVVVKLLRAGFAELGRREARALAAVHFGSGSGGSSAASGTRGGVYAGSSSPSSRNSSSNSRSSGKAGGECGRWDWGGAGVGGAGVPVVGLRGTFRFLGHFAVVLDLAAGSLLDAAFGGRRLGLSHRSLWRPVDARAGVFPPPPRAHENAFPGSATAGNGCGLVVSGSRIIINISNSSGSNISVGSSTSKSTSSGSNGAAAATARAVWVSRVAARASSRCAPPLASHTPAHVVLGVAAHLLAALARLRALGIFHADLKPENVLLVPTASAGAAHWGPGSSPPGGYGGGSGYGGSDHASGGFGAPAGLCEGLPFVPVLADFGNAVHAASEGPLYEQAAATAATGDADAAGHGAMLALSFDCQTLAYRAPEVLLGLPGAVGCPADAWSLGVLLAELWLGLPLFRQAAEAAEDPAAAPTLHRPTASVGGASVFSGSEPGSDLVLQQRAWRAHRARALMVCDVEALLGSLRRTTFKRARFYTAVFSGGTSSNDGSASSSSSSSSSSRSLGAGGDARDEEGKCDYSDSEDEGGGNLGDDDDAGVGLSAGAAAGAHRRRLRHVKRVGELLRTQQGPAPPLLVSLVSGLLCLDPTQRLTPLQALRHPALQSLGGGAGVPYAALAAAERAEAAALKATTEAAEAAEAAAAQADRRRARAEAKAARAARRFAVEATAATAEAPALPLSSAGTGLAEGTGLEGNGSSGAGRRQSTGRIKLVGRREREAAAAEAEAKVEAACTPVAAEAASAAANAAVADADEYKATAAEAATLVSRHAPSPSSPFPAFSPPSSFSAEVGAAVTDAAAASASPAGSPRKRPRVKLIRTADRAPSAAANADATTAASTPENALRALPRCKAAVVAAAKVCASATAGDETESDGESLLVVANTAAAADDIVKIIESDDDADDDGRREGYPGDKVKSVYSNLLSCDRRDPSESEGRNVQIVRNNHARAHASSAHSVVGDNGAARNSLMSVVGSNCDSDSSSDSENKSDIAGSKRGSECYVEHERKGTDSASHHDPGCQGAGSHQGHIRIVGLTPQGLASGALPAGNPSADFCPSTGAYVLVAPRTGPGQNHPGGVALVTAVRFVSINASEGSGAVINVVDVQYVLSRQREAGLLLDLIAAHDPLASVPKRARNRPAVTTEADTSTAVEAASSAAAPSGHCADKRHSSSTLTIMPPTSTPLPQTGAFTAAFAIVDSPATGKRKKRRRLLRGGGGSSSQIKNTGSSTSSSGVNSGSSASRADEAWGGHALSPSLARKSVGLHLNRPLNGTLNGRVRVLSAGDREVALAARGSGGGEEGDGARAYARGLWAEQRAVPQHAEKHGQEGGGGGDWTPR